MDPKHWEKIFFVSCNPELNRGVGKGISPGGIVVLNCKREDKWIRLRLGGVEFCKNHKQFSYRSFQITDWVNFKILKTLRPFLAHGIRTNSESKIGTFSLQDNSPTLINWTLKNLDLNPFETFWKFFQEKTKLEFDTVGE